MNLRGAVLCCRAVLPAMIRQCAGHIINMSPPLDTSILPERIAYGISKLGMTLLTVGLAEEVRRQNVAVNSLWPATIIESQASINHRLGTPAMWRKPDILVDCVLRDRPYEYDRRWRRLTRRYRMLTAALLQASARPAVRAAPIGRVQTR